MMRKDALGFSLFTLNKERSRLSRKYGVLQKRMKYRWILGLHTKTVLI
ncbi:hypothetical protein BASP5262_07135 [Bacillus spizizenii]|nr:hypothetical protein DJ97_2749 [Bacillus spizizenii]SPT95724.1 Uncharacterised protein [Bacillus spizizenii]